MPLQYFQLRMGLIASTVRTESLSVSGRVSDQQHLPSRHLTACGWISFGASLAPPRPLPCADSKPRVLFSSCSRGPIAFCAGWKACAPSPRSSMGNMRSTILKEPRPLEMGKAATSVGCSLFRLPTSILLPCNSRPIVSLACAASGVLAARSARDWPRLLVAS